MSNLTKQLKRKGRSNKEARHVRLYHHVLTSSAWQSLDAVARAIYIEMASRYAGAGSNNGRIGYAVREAADALHISKATASRAIRQLQDRGFIVATQQGTFNRKVRHSTEWRLTEFGCDVTNTLATKNFMTWAPEKQNTVSYANRTVPVVKPSGTSHETVPRKNARYGT